MHDYTAAPACQILATHCTACGKPLLDAESVTAGLGPVCRDKYGIPDELDEETRRRANKLIHLCARADVSHEDFTAAIAELSLMGCTALARRMFDRAGRVVFALDERGVAVAAPYDERFLANRGRGRWDREEKVTRYAPAHATQAVRAVQSAWGPAALVRLVIGQRDLYVAANDERLGAMLRSIEEKAPADEPAAAEPCPVKWKGHPVKVRGAWGVRITSPISGDNRPRKGDRVEITTRGGKTWVATLTTDALNTRYGWEASTGR